eukprot:Awhi_evm1s6022
MIFSQLLVASVIALSTAAPLSVTVSITTCGSYFINLDYECRNAGLVGARDANAVCPSQDCELGFCCKYSVPQLTPPKPQSIPQPLPQPQVVTANPPKTFTGFSPYYPPTNCRQFLKDHPSNFCNSLGFKDLIGKLPSCKNGCTYKKCCGRPIYSDQDFKNNEELKNKGRIVKIDSDCQSPNRCFVTIKGYNFERDCSISIHMPNNGNTIYHERTECNREKVRFKLHSDVARKYGEILINIHNVKSDNWSNTFPAIIH